MRQLSCILRVLHPESCGLSVVPVPFPRRGTSVLRRSLGWPPRSASAEGQNAAARGIRLAELP